MFLRIFLLASLMCVSASAENQAYKGHAHLAKCIVLESACQMTRHRKCANQLLEKAECESASQHTHSNL